MRAAIGASALQFAREALAGDVDLSYGQLTDDARKSMSHQQFEQLLDSVKPFGPFDNFDAPQILTVSGWGFMSPRSGVAVCSKDSSHPDSAVSIAIKNLRQQAYAVLETKGAKETWAVVLWLIPDAGGVWRVQAFYTTLATVLGKPAGDIVAEARKERSVGHSLNAILSAEMARPNASFLHIVK